MPRKRIDRNRTTIEMDTELYTEAQSKRLEFQAVEGVEMSKIEWNNRLIRYALKHIKPEKRPKSAI